MSKQEYHIEIEKNLKAWHDTGRIAFLNRMRKLRRDYLNSF